MLVAVPYYCLYSSEGEAARQPVFLAKRRRGRCSRDDGGLAVSKPDLTAAGVSFVKYVASGTTGTWIITVRRCPPLRRWCYVLLGVCRGNGDPPDFGQRCATCWCATQRQDAGADPLLVQVS